MNKKLEAGTLYLGNQKVGDVKSIEMNVEKNDISMKDIDKIKISYTKPKPLEVGRISVICPRGEIRWDKE